MGCMKFGLMRDLESYIKKMEKKREINRIGSVFYGIPKDFPFPVLEKK
jgi:hypothetical protein